jgi:hypothetical protein
MKNRKTQAHLEMIFSFVIFIGFVSAIFIFINPLQQQPVSYTSFQRVYDKLLSNVSINYENIPVVLSSVQNTCFLIDNPLNYTQNILAKEFNGNTVSAETNLATITLSPGFKTYTLYFSNSFDEDISGLSSCSYLGASNYSFGAMSFERAILYENLVLLNNDYKKDYSGLQKKLGLEKDFEFVVSNFSGYPLINDSIYVNKIKSGNVVSRDFLLKTINKKGDQVDIFFNLRVW